MWRYKEDPRTVSYEVDRACAGVSVLGIIYMLVCSNGEVTLPGAAASLCALSNVAWFGWNTNNDEYKTGCIRASDSIVYHSIACTILCLSAVLMKPKNELAFCSLSSALAVAMALMNRCLNRKQYESYGPCTNAGLIVGHSLKDGVVTATAFAAAHALHMCASSAIGAIWSFETKILIDGSIGFYLFCLLYPRLPECLQEQRRVKEVS